MTDIEDIELTPEEAAALATLPRMSGSVAITSPRDRNIFMRSPEGRSSFAMVTVPGLNGNSSSF